MILSVRSQFEGRIIQAIASVNLTVKECVYLLICGTLNPDTAPNTPKALST